MILSWPTCGRRERHQHYRHQIRKPCVPELMTQMLGLEAYLRAGRFLQPSPAHTLETLISPDRVVAITSSPAKRWKYGEAWGRRAALSGRRRGEWRCRRESPCGSPPPTLRATSPATLRYAGEELGYGVEIGAGPATWAVQASALALISAEGVSSKTATLLAMYCASSSAERCASAPVFHDV